jgi:hypothetical protein
MPHSTPHSRAVSLAEPTAHRFLDETGDTAFYGAGGTLILGSTGVSQSFGIGLVRIDHPLEEARAQILALQREVESDRLLNRIPSVRKRIESGGFFFHACKDAPEVRAVLLRYLLHLRCQAEVVIGRKIPALFEKQHHGREEEFYADLLSHLLKRRMKRHRKLVLNVAERGSSTREQVLNDALLLALERAHDWGGIDAIRTHVVFNVQNPRTEPLLTVSDYLSWSVQRIFERGETRYYDYLIDKFRLVVDLYDHTRYAGHRNYYTKRRPLTAGNKLGPPFA